MKTSLMAWAAMTALLSPVAIQSIQLSDTESAWLAQHSVVRVGFDPNRPPFSMIDGQGDFAGIDAGVLQAIGRKTNLRFTPQRGGNLTAALDHLAAKEIDALVGIDSPHAVEGVIFTAPYARAPLVLVGRTAGPFGLTLAGLRGQTVAVVTRDEDVAAWLRKNVDPTANVVAFDSTAKALDAVVRGKALVLATDLPAAYHAVRTVGASQVKLAGVLDHELDQCFAVRADWPELVSILNQGISELSPAERDAVFQPWIGGAATQRGTAGGAIWPVILVTLIGVAAAAGIAWRGRRQSKQFNKERRRLISELSGVHERLSTLRGEKTRILRMTSHQLHRPIAEIALHAQNLRATQADDSAGAVLTKAILTDVGRVLHALEALQEMQALDEGSRTLNLTAVNVGAVILEALSTFEHAAAKREVRLSPPSPGKAALARADVDVLRKVIESLVSSALKVSASGSAISVALWQAEDRVLLTISDEGPGIAVEDQTQLDRYHHTGSPFEGAEQAATYDLALVKNLVIAMEGWLWCESHPGHGATFVIELPAMKQTPAEGVSTETAPAAPPRRSVQRA